MIDPTESNADGRDRAALERLRLSPHRRTIKLTADFGRDWPLWEDDEEGDVLNIMSSPADYGLSTELTLRIREWFDFWDAHYDPDAMWDASKNHAAWHRTGREIASALRAEVREFADVAFD